MTMTRDEFDGFLSRSQAGPRSRGMTEFVRGLVADVPQRVPPELLARYAEPWVAAVGGAAHRLYGAGRAHAVRVDGEVWICLYARPDAE